MSAPAPVRPESNEYAPYYEKYVSLVPDADLVETLERQGAETLALLRGLTEEQVINDVLLHAQPTKRFVQVSEVAALAVFLASKDAASITGAIIPIDGGWTAQ